MNSRQQAIYNLRQESSFARNQANKLQWSNHALAVDWLAYALQCERQARQLEQTTSANYYAQLYAAMQAYAIPQPVQLALI